MKCSRCGAKNSDKKKFCGDCGASLDEGAVLETFEEESINDVSLDELKKALSGRYEIIGEIGRGGMGIVYHAREVSLDRDVAIKVLPRELSFDKQFRERFKREVKTLAKLRHQNIVTLYSADEAGGFIYFTMEYVNGKTLSDYIDEKKTLNSEEIYDITRKICAGLEHAHEEGVLHRDLSPENVMIDRKGNVYVMDFGIAKALSGTKVTRTGATMGKAAYMSPEQCRGEELDARSDIYSLGVMMYQMAFGEIPFEGEPVSVMYRHVNEEPKPPVKAKKELPTYLVKVIMSTLAKKRDKRPSGAKELMDICGAGIGVSPKRVKVKKTAATGSSSGLKKAVFGGVFLLLIAGIAAGVYMGKQPVAGDEILIGNMEFCYIPGGTFMMGSPASEKQRNDDEKQHEVTLSPFWMGKYEVTQKQYMEIMGNNPSDFKGDDNLAVEGVSWYDAVEFCNKLSIKHGLKPYYNIDKSRKDPNNKSSYDDIKWTVTILGGSGFRLPTEAEWEYACRAGTTTAFLYGDKMDSTMANFDGNNPYNAGKGVYREKTTSVGSFKPNAWGLYDMHGNVWEWCWDWYGDYSSVANDPKGIDSGEYRVLRGGSWNSYGNYLRSAYRYWNWAFIRSFNYGFRAVRSVN